MHQAHLIRRSYYICSQISIKINLRVNFLTKIDSIDKNIDKIYL
jgi:hypothetical protein